MNPFMQLFSYYKRDFGLEGNVFFLLFEKLLSGSLCSIFDFAPQITPMGIHPARFRVGYQKEDLKEGLKAISLFLDEISVCDNVFLNRTLLDGIVGSHLDLSKVAKLGIGLDIREDIHDSKVKYYLQVKDYPEKVNQVLANHPPIESIEAYPMNDLFGINMYFDGRTDIEIYPSLLYGNLGDASLMEKLKLQNMPYRFLEGCRALIVSFIGRHGRVFHFYPRAPTRFVRMIGSRELIELYGNAQILSHIIKLSNKIDYMRVVISLLEEEIHAQNIAHINADFIVDSYGK